MPIRSYLTAQDLRVALSPAMYLALFDDDNTGDVSAVDASAGVLSVLAESLVLVTSWLPDIYKTLPPETSPAGIVTGGDSMPILLKVAQLQYARVLSYRRHPEYVKTYGAEPGGTLWKEANEFLERIQDGVQRVTSNDTPPEVLPENVGGSAAYDGPRIAISSPDGTPNSGDW
jgi:hypothetical protein